MYFLFNLSQYVKSYGHLSQILAFFMIPALQIWPCGKHPPPVLLGLTTMLISWNNKERDKGMAYPFEYTHTLPGNLAKPQLQIGQRALEEGCYGSRSQITLPIILTIQTLNKVGY